MMEREKITENLQQILNYFVVIDRISKQRDSDIDISSDTIVLDLKFFYDQNYEKMKSLMNNTKMLIINSKDPNSQEQEPFQQILNLFTWLVKEYYSPNDTEQNLREIWNTRYRDVTKKRTQIDSILETII
jgi:hypothetical protein